MSGIPTSGGGGDGDAVLAGGTTASPQIFTGVNEFNGATNGNVGLIEQTATYNNSFIQTSGEQTNFIRQNGATQGYIVQEADDSVIKQEGEDAEILQEGENADFKQQGDGCRILQLGQNAQITQSGLNSVISSPRVRCSNLPLIGNDLTNKTYVDAEINDTYSTRSFTFFNQILAVNTSNSGYSYITEMEVEVTPKYLNADGTPAGHFKITMNGQYSGSSGTRMIYVNCRLYRNFAHLTAASNANPNTTQVNSAGWITHNARVNFNSTLHNNQMSGLFIDTDPQVHTDGKIYYSIGIRPVAYSTGTGGQFQNQFKMNCMYGTSASSVRDPCNTSQMLVEEFKVL